MVAISLALVYAGFEAGRMSAGYSIASSMIERIDLKGRNRELEKENRALQHRAATAEVAQRVDRQAQTDAQRMVSELQAETARQQQELQAQLLGVPVRGLRIGIYVAASILTAAAVTTAGSIGFVGLVTPHLVRLATGSSHRAVIPAAALAGGALVVVADLLARTIVAPRQLPVGALTALIGVPLFLILMRRSPAH